jgi:hypothetical protein
MRRKIPIICPPSKIWVPNMADTYFGAAADNTVHDITTEDLAIWAWVKINSGASNSYIVDKRPGADQGYAFAMISSSGSR